MSVTTAPSSRLIIAALQLPGIGPSKVRTWLKEMPDVSPTSLATGFQGHSAEAVAEAVWKADEILQQCVQLDIQTISLADGDYPETR